MAEIYEGDIYTLTDETGKESEFELIGSCEFEGTTYLALIPVEEGMDEYVILRLEADEQGEEILVTIDDDDEFDDDDLKDLVVLSEEELEQEE